MAPTNFILLLLIGGSICQDSQEDGGGSIEISFRVVEESHEGAEVGNVLVESGIEPIENQKFEFVDEPLFPFALNTLTGIITVAGRLDRESWCARRAECLDRVDVYVLSPSQTPFRILHLIKVNLYVYDINDNSPHFAPAVNGVVKVSIP